MPPPAFFIPTSVDSVSNITSTPGQRPYGPVHSGTQWNAIPTAAIAIPFEMAIGNGGGAVGIPRPRHSNERAASVGGLFHLQATQTGLLLVTQGTAGTPLIRHGPCHRGDI